MSDTAEKCDFNAGDSIAGRHSIEKDLGEGMFGRVFKVKDQQSSHMYALKLFKFWEMCPKERKTMFARFEMEFETGQIESRYLVKSIEHGLVMGNPFLVMEFCPNGDLRQFAGGRKNADLAKIGREVLYARLRRLATKPCEISRLNITLLKRGRYADSQPALRHGV